MKELYKKITAFIAHGKEFFTTPSNSQRLTILTLAILFLSVPITVFSLQQRTNLKQHAAGNVDISQLYCSCNSPGNSASKWNSYDCKPHNGAYVFGGYCNAGLACADNGGKTETVKGPGGIKCIPSPQSAACVNSLPNSSVPNNGFCVSADTQDQYGNVTHHTPTAGCKNYYDYKGFCSSNEFCDTTSNQLYGGWPCVNLNDRSLYTIKCISNNTFQFITNPSTANPSHVAVQRSCSGAYPICDANATQPGSPWPCTSSFCSSVDPSNKVGNYCGTSSNNKNIIYSCPDPNPNPTPALDCSTYKGGQYTCQNVNGPGTASCVPTPGGPGNGGPGNGGPSSTQTCSYTECETGAHNGCWASGVPTGHVGCVVNDSNGNYQSCSDTGQTCGSGGGTGGSPTPPSGYTFCSNENSTCTLKGTEDVAYGASGKFNFFSSKTGSIACNNAILGPDPILNTVKYCFVKPSGTGGGTGTTLSLVLALPGIGIQTGAIGSSNPSHLVRSVKVELYDATVTNPGGAGTTPLGSGTGIVVYDSQGNNAGYFDSITSPAKPIIITFKGTLPTNNEYKVLIEMPQYLYQLAIPLTQADQNIPNAFVITQGANVVTSPTTLNPGAITQPNSMSILADYNQILTCFKNSTDPTCIKTSDGIPFTDLDDNGVVNLVDLNIWIRSLSILEQNQTGKCNGGTCRGD